MSDKIVNISLDVTLIDKARLVPGKKPNKAGKMPQYLSLDLVLRKDGPDQYGNHYFVKQSNYEKDVPKENRAEMPILGNGKTIIGPDGPRSQGGRTSRLVAPQKPAAAEGGDDGDSSVPF